MIKNIYLIRHGQTDYNKKKIVQGGGIDSELNVVGVQQALMFYDKYKKIPFTKVFTSALQRTVQSVQAFINDGISHTKLTGLNEINWGNREGSVINQEENAYYLNLIQQWEAGNYQLAIEGGESPIEVQERLKLALQTIEHDPSENILVCMHGRAMRILLCTMFRYDLSKMETFKHQNLCLYKLIYTGSMYRLDYYEELD